MLDKPRSMSAGSPTPKRSGGGSKPKGAVRAKSGCYTCRIRRKKCDEKPDAEGSCQTCVRLRLQCLGFGAKRPDWMREGNSVTELRGKIKGFLAQNGMIKGHSASSAPLHPSPPPHTPGASNSSDSASPPSLSLPPLAGSSVATVQGVNTPLSATSTLGPDALNNESPPPSPPTSSASHHHPNDCSFPPNHSHAHSFNEHTMGDSRPHHPAHGQASGSASGVLLLSKGRPTGGSTLVEPNAPSGARSSRRHHIGNTGAFGSQQNGHGGLLLSLGDEPMDAVNTNGAAHSTAHGHTTTRRSHSPSLQRRRTTDLLGYGYHTTETLTFPRSYSVTAPSHTRPYQTSPHFSPASVSASSSMAPSSGLFYNYSRGPSSNAHPTANAMNSTSNTAGTSPHLSGSISSSVSPPHTSLPTPFTPYNALPPLPMYSPGAMDYPSTTSTSSSTTMSSSSSRMSHDGLLSPTSDTGLFDLNAIHWDSPSAPMHHSTTGIGSNYGSSNGTSPHVRVKPEPIDNVGLDVGEHAADDYDSYRGLGLFSRYSDDGCATPVGNTNNTTPGRPNNGVPVNFTTDNNNSYSYPAPPSTNSNSYSSYHTSTPYVIQSTDGTDYDTYPHHSSADANPYLSGPQLSPDSPTPPYGTARGNPLLGYNSESSTPHMGGYAHGPPSGQFALHPTPQHSGSGRHNGVGQSGLGGHAVNGNGNGHGSSGSSWLRNDENYVPERLPSVQQVPTAYGWIHGNNVNGGGLGTFHASPTVRNPNLPPPNIQSSFSPLYYDSFDIEMDSTYVPQQMNHLGPNCTDTSAMMANSYYEPNQAPITDMQFYGMEPEDQQQYFQAHAPLQPLQMVLADPNFVNRGDGTLVNHYLIHVRPRQYFFLDDRIVQLLQHFVFENDIVRDVICSVASVHKRRSREEIMGPKSASSSSSDGSTTPSPDRPVLVLPKGGALTGDDANSVEYHARTQQQLKAYIQNPSKLTKAEAMAGLQYVSSVLFEGGFGDWDVYLSDIACAWVETNVLAPFRQAGDAYLIDRLSRMTREDELGSFVVRTTMWFEVLASVTVVRTPRFLDVYRKLFDGARVIEIDGVATTEGEFSMLQVMGCDNITFLALAEISALAAWKEKETKAQTLSSVELVKRGSYIEGRYLANSGEGNSEASAGANNRQTINDDSLENRRRLTADIFRASARLYLHTVLSGDKPSVREISEGVRETVEALKRVPTQRDSELRRSVVRSVVFPICLAGCMTDDEGHRATLKNMLEVEGGAGNCGAVVNVMEVVWARRVHGRKHEDVNWRDVLHESKVPLLLV